MTIEFDRGYVALQMIPLLLTHMQTMARTAEVVNDQAVRVKFCDIMERLSEPANVAQWLLDHADAFIAEYQKGQKP